MARLRKPSAALWAVNRLATTDGRSLAALFDAVARVRKTQLRDRRAAAEALRAQRAALDALVARGKQILIDSGLSASQQALRRLSDTLMGAAVDEEHAKALRRGELTEELHAPGFEAFSGARLSAHPRLRLVRSAASTTAPRVDHEASAARAAEQRQRSAEAERLTREAEERARELSALESEKTDARARLSDVERRLQAARHAARRAATAAKRARKKSGPA